MEEQVQVFNFQTIPQQLEARIKNLYKNYFEDAKNYIFRNSGTLDDARDIFQEVALIYFKQIQKPDFTITNTERNYIHGICKNLWLKKLRERKFETLPDEQVIENIKDVSIDELEQLSEKNSLMELISKKMDQITEECRQIIYLAFYLKKSSLEIAGTTGYSEQFIKVKKYRCLQGLKKMVIGSSDYRHIND